MVCTTTTTLNPSSYCHLEGGVGDVGYCHGKVRAGSSCGLRVLG